ncbi:MAG: hypothetical protein QGH40_02635, partial [bacterium]|nr:hypothetical protein [bacterium]
MKFTDISRYRFLILVCLLILAVGSRAGAQIDPNLDFNYANTYVMVVRIDKPPYPNPPDSNNERYVYEVHNPSARVIPRLTDPNSFSITVDREENLYIADKVDYSVIPAPVVQPQDDLYYKSFKALPACKDFTKRVIMDTYAASIPPSALPDGLNPSKVEYPTLDFSVYTEGDQTGGAPGGKELFPGGQVEFIWWDPNAEPNNMESGLDLPYPILFFRPKTADGSAGWVPGVDPLGSWHGGGPHRYDYHMHALDNQNLKAVLDLNKDGEFEPVEEFETAVCYPHTYVMTSEGDNGADAGSGLHGYIEPWGQEPTGQIWLPNGTWHHRNHRTGGVNDTVRVIRAVYQLTNVFGHLYGWEKSNNYGSDVLKDTLALWYANDFKWSLRQCGDPCANGPQGELNAPMAYVNNPFQLIVGPSNRMYLFSPYDPNPANALQFKDPTFEGETGDITYPDEWTPFDVLPTAGNPNADIIVNVDCQLSANGQRYQNLRYIGLATFSAERDWVYLSSADEFTVGDQFDGKGGVMYYRQGTEIMKILDDSQEHTLSAHGDQPWGPAPEAVSLGGDIELNADTNLSADGIGNLYFITTKPSKWGIKSVESNWETQDNGILQQRQVRLRRALDFKLWISPRKGGDAYNPPGTDFNGEKQIVGGLQFRIDPAYQGDVSGVEVPDLTPTDPTSFGKSVHIDLATVNDASPPIEGKCQVDIAPLGLVPGKFEKFNPYTDIIYLEDWGTKTDAGNDQSPFVARWQFENYAGDYTVNDNSPWFGHECVLENISDIAGNEPPYRGPTWLWNPLHFNFKNQRYYERDAIDPNKNGFIGGWSSNILGDPLTSQGNPTTKAHDGREYQWSVWLVANAEQVFDPPKQIYPDPGECSLPDHDNFFVPQQLKGDEAHPEHHEHGGYEFSFVFKDAGVYEVQLQARTHIYDYRAAGVMPKFIVDPDEYIDEDGGQESGNVAVVIARGAKLEGDPQTGFVRYYCNADQYAANYVSPPPESDSYPIIARRRVMVGSKLPDYGAWAAMQLFARKEGRPNVPTNMEWVTEEYNIDDPVEIELDEDQQLEVQAVAAMKYFKDVDEKTIDQYIKGRYDTVAGKILDASDLAAAIHDQFSGVVPGSVQFRWSFYNGSEEIQVDTLGTQATPDPPSTETAKAPNLVMARKWNYDTNSGRINQGNCPGLAPAIGFEFDTTENSGLCGSDLITKMKNRLDDSQPPLIDLKYYPEEPGSGKSSSQYVPNWSNMALYYSDKDAELPPYGSSPSLTGPGISYIPGEGMKQLYTFPTPSNGRPKNCYENVTGKDGYGSEKDRYRVRVQLFADVLEYTVTAGDDEISKIFNASKFVFAGGGDAQKIAQAFTPEVHAGVKLCEKFVDVKVNDTTAPVVTLSALNNESGVTTGDLFSNNIVLRILDNNPYTAPGNPGDDLPGMGGLLWTQNQKMQGRLLYTIVPDSVAVDQSAVKPASLEWGDLPSEKADPNWCDIIKQLGGDLKPELLVTDDYDRMMHSPVGVTYEFVSDQWRMNADGGCPPGSAPDPLASNDSRAGKAVLYAVSVDASGNGLMVQENNSNALLNQPALLNGSAMTTYGEGQTSCGPGYDQADNVGDENKASSKKAND